MMRLLVVVVVLAVGSAAPAAPPFPKSLDPRVEIRLFAESPQIVTPTDVAVDHRGRVWAIESNTHFRPAGYTRHSSDRVLVFYDDDHDGKADRYETFADGFVYAMSIAVPFGEGVFVATRREVVHLADANGDGKADTRRVILTLDTPGDYPHNGLAGFAFDGLGYMYIGLGENLGAAYRLIGSDGRTLSGGGEGGCLFRCRLDGSDLTRWATGFWNPHASCVDAFGRMFTVDNDPDDRPPCRMLHIIPGGDYGYRFRNGRRGIHPFTAWDGELPGTLPMVSGTGEAPSGIVAYESDALGAEFRGDVLATSWGDHRIDRFRVRPQGTSFTSKAEPLIIGGDHFRPVGLALAPDGSLFATDWMLQDYKVHGQGRIWRIGPKKRAPGTVVDDLALVPRLAVPELRDRLDSPRLDIRRLAARTSADRDRHFLEAAAIDRQASPRGRLEASWALARHRKAATLSPALSTLKNAEIPLLWPDLEGPADESSGKAIVKHLLHPSVVNPSIELLRLVSSFNTIASKEPAFVEKVANLDDRFVFAALVQALADHRSEGNLPARLRPERTPSPRVRLALLLAARESVSQGAADAILATALGDPDFEVRRTAIQWVGEERMFPFRTALERQLADPSTTPDLFEAALASLEMLDRVKRVAKDEFSGADYALRLARDERAADAVRALALRMVPANAKGLDIKLLTRLLASSSPALRLEALRTLGETTFPEAAGLLRGVATDEKALISLRLEAIAGLAGVLKGNDHDPPTLAALRRLLADSDPQIQIAVLRSLRTSLGGSDVRNGLTAFGLALSRQPLSDQAREEIDQLALSFRLAGRELPASLSALATPRPVSTDDWLRLAASGGDVKDGERVFEHPNAGGCFHCHTVNGRGGRIGPDLSIIARSANRRKLAESILEPSKEIAPQFTSWNVVTHDGRVISGMIVSEDREGRVRIGTSEGTVIELGAGQIEERRPLSKSVMPEHLVDVLTPRDFSDLIAFLASLK